jgi:hypothetical protein
MKANATAPAMEIFFRIWFIATPCPFRNFGHPVSGCRSRVLQTMPYPTELP